MALARSRSITTQTICTPGKRLARATTGGFGWIPRAQPLMRPNRSPVITSLDAHTDADKAHLYGVADRRRDSLRQQRRHQAGDHRPGRRRQLDGQHVHHGPASRTMLAYLPTPGSYKVTVRDTSVQPTVTVQQDKRRSDGGNPDGPRATCERDHRGRSARKRRHECTCRYAQPYERHPVHGLSCRRRGWRCIMLTVTTTSSASRSTAVLRAYTDDG